MHLAARTDSSLRICRTSVRTTLAMDVQLVRPMTRERLTALASPRMACSRMTSSRPGTLSRISVRRISRASSRRGAMPLAAPTTTAMQVDTSVEAMPMNRERRPPDQIMEKRSRPRLSVPNGNAPHGAALQWLRSIYARSLVVNRGTVRHPAAMMNRTARARTGFPAAHGFFLPAVPARAAACPPAQRNISRDLILTLTSFFRHQIP